MYGLMNYKYTINLGNEIQSIASRRFLPEIDYYIDHEKINEFRDAKNVKMIMNGYFLDCLKAWPPSRNIDPLLISMHFSPREDIKNVILSKDSKDYLNEFGPVGCRDIITQEILNENGVDAYFSGCLTLTLDSGNKKLNDNIDEYIVINTDNPNKLKSFLKDKTDEKIYTINQDFPPSFKKAFLHQIPKSLYNFTSYYSDSEKFFLAENLLRLYENASCIITDRLHCALPTLALKTPVLLLNSRQKQERFNGLNTLCLVSNFREYQNNYNIFDVNDPPENSDEYIKIRNDLIKKCRKFTGHINDSIYTYDSYSEILNKNTYLISRNAADTREYIVDVLKTSKKYEKKIAKQQETIEKQQKIIDEYKNSKNRKISFPFRKNKK